MHIMKSEGEFWRWTSITLPVPSWSTAFFFFGTASPPPCWRWRQTSASYVRFSSLHPSFCVGTPVVFDCWQHQTFAKIELLETNWGTKCRRILVEVPKTPSAYLLGVVGWLYLVSAWEKSHLKWCMRWSTWVCKRRAVPEQISGISRHISRRWSHADHLQSWLWSKRVWKS